MPTPFIIGPNETKKLHALRDLAAKSPVDIPPLMERLKTPAGKRAHMDQMSRQSVMLPLGWMVTFSLELNHPRGTCRHMSMSSPDQSRVPSPEAAWMAAAELGFVGDIRTCAVWMEDLAGGEDGTKRHAVNLVQPVAVMEAAGGSVN